MWEGSTQEAITKKEQVKAHLEFAKKHNNSSFVSWDRIIAVRWDQNEAF